MLNDLHCFSHVNITNCGIKQELKIFKLTLKKKRYRTQEMQNVNNMMAKITLQKSKLTGFKFSKGKTIK